MKRLFLMLAVMAAFVGCQSNKCEISGTIENLNATGYIYLVDAWKPKNTIDSVLVENGNTFHFKGVKHAPTLAKLTLENKKGVTYIFVESGKVVVAGDMEKREVKVSGTPLNDKLTAWDERSSKIYADYKEAREAGDKERMEALEKEDEAMNKEYFTQNSGNLFGVFMLRQISSSLTATEVLKYVDQFPEEIKSLYVVERIKSKAERRFKTEPQAEGSDYVPYYIDIEQPNFDGEIVSLKSVVENKQNRYVLLDFWASWCGPCMGEVPTLLEAYKLYHDKGFEIYGVSFDNAKNAWMTTVENRGMNWVNVSELNRFDNKAAEDYGVEAIPTNVLIDCSNGVIIARNLHGQQVLDKLAELLK